RRASRRPSRASPPRRGQGQGQAPDPPVEEALRADRARGQHRRHGRVQEDDERGCAMSVVLAVPRLYDLVVARFAADAAASDPPTTPPAQSFGWREPAKKTSAPRIVWVPGDDSSGDAGPIVPPRQVN